MSVVIIASSYFVEYLCQSRILPLTASFPFFTLALRSFLWLETLVARQVAYGLLSPLKHDTPLSLLPQNFLDLTDLFVHFGGYAPPRYQENAYSRSPCLFHDQVILYGSDSPLRSSLFHPLCGQRPEN